MNAQIAHNFKYHPPSETSPVDHARIRDKAKELALLIDEILPPASAREKATAITHVESAMMWACAGVCRHPQPEQTFSSTAITR